MVGGAFTGVIVNAEPLQIVAAWLGTTGCGVTVTTIVNGVPGQLPALGVTVYVSVAVVLTVLRRVWLIWLCPVACALPPVIAPTGALTGVVHVYVVPAGTIVVAVGIPLTGLIINVLSLQIEAACAGIAGFGSTVTVIVNGVPGQAPDLGVTV